LKGESISSLGVTLSRWEEGMAIAIITVHLFETTTGVPRCTGIAGEIRVIIMTEDGIMRGGRVLAKEEDNRELK